MTPAAIVIATKAKASAKASAIARLHPTASPTIILVKKTHPATMSKVKKIQNSKRAQMTRKINHPIMEMLRSKNKEKSERVYIVIQDLMVSQRNSMS
jgi:hypothetical protein